jgi:Rieske Fe-S protein
MPLGPVNPGAASSVRLGMTTETDRTEQRPAPPAPAPPSRRRVIGIAGAIGVGGLLAACGGSDETSPPASPATSSSESAPPAPESSTTAGGAGEVLVKTADVQVGGGVILKDKKIVVTQPTSGDFKGFTAVCTHQGCLVGSVSSGTISCPCHGSQYSAENGSVTGGPAPRPLKAVKVAVEGDSVVEA